MKYYSEKANVLFNKYRSVNASDVHECWADLLPEQAGLACDIGAGSGRDAAWLADKGWQVIAVEPCRELRELAQRGAADNMSSHDINWLDDKLPELRKLRILGHRFNLILLSAVWMHLSAEDQSKALRIVSELLAPGGIMVFSLRHGPDDGRGFASVSADELVHAASTRALILLRDEKRNDLARPQVSWDYLVFQRADGGMASR